MSRHDDDEDRDRKIIICSGKSASLGLESALAAASGPRHAAPRAKYEQAKALIDEANAEMEGG